MGDFKTNKKKVDNTLFVVCCGKPSGPLGLFFYQKITHFNPKIPYKQARKEGGKQGSGPSLQDILIFLITR